jgi:hypothetical protein
MAADRRGVALIVVVVTLAVMMILATVIVANTAGTSYLYHLQQAVAALRRFGYEIGTASKKPSFQGDVGRNPSRLSHLYVIITTADRNSCGTVYSGADVNKWVGPYHLVPMARDSGYQITPGLNAIDTLIRTPANAAGNQPGTLSIIMRNVSPQLAADLGMAFDGISTGGGPAITFAPNGTNPVDVQYNVPILGC